MNFQWMPQAAKEAVQNLDLSLSVPDVPEIDLLLSKTVLFQGKKFRPILLFLTAQLLKIPLDKMVPYARASEFVHAATLAHDDVIDESQMRRNRPTLNASSSNARAILAGDLLLARVMAELSHLGKMEVIQDLARALDELVQGEWLQLSARNQAQINRGHLEQVARKKTASLMIWCCRVPAFFREDCEAVIVPLTHFGECLGVAFQMIDDIIDYDPEGEKPFAQDLREGLINFVTLEMFEINPELRVTVQAILGVPSSVMTWPWKESELETARIRVRERAREKLQQAKVHLTQLGLVLNLPEDSALLALETVVQQLSERID